MAKQSNLHSLDVALDRSSTHTAYAYNKEGIPLIKVHVFPYQGHDHYVAYTLTPKDKDGHHTMSNDMIGTRSDLLQWITVHTEVKTLRGADGFLGRLIWKAQREYPLLQNLDKLEQEEFEEAAQKRSLDAEELRESHASRDRLLRQTRDMCERMREETTTYTDMHPGYLKEKIVELALTLQAVVSVVGLQNAEIEELQQQLRKEKSA